MTDTRVSLPKYVQNANRIIETLAAQPDKIWSKTQRELGELLGFTQPELSTLIKLLLENEKVRRGGSLAGVRGKNFVLELVDDAPFTHSVPRNRAKQGGMTTDRALAPGEELQGVINLGDLSIEKIGLGVMRALQDAWTKEERHTQIRSEQMQRIRDFREQLTDERRLRSQLATDKENLQRQIHDLEHNQTQMRGEINSLLLKTKSSNDYHLRDIVDEESLKVLENLMKIKPGHYRESDREIGLAEDTPIAS